MNRPECAEAIIREGLYNVTHRGYSAQHAITIAITIMQFYVALLAGANSKTTGSNQRRTSSAAWEVVLQQLDQE
jgi:hypothetical protein